MRKVALVSAGVSKFGKALGDHWLTKMSGPLSVPFAVLALIFKDRLAGILFGALAFVCLVVASYAVWRRERIAVLGLERELIEERERTKPKVELVFDKHCGACQDIVHAGDGTEVRLSIGVRNCGSQSLHDVRVFIKRGSRHALDAVNSHSARARLGPSRLFAARACSAPAPS